MPHRDPETGQFVSGGDHAGAYVDADEVLQANTRFTTGDTNLTIVNFDENNTPEDNHLSLTVQQDYRILAIEVFGRTVVRGQPNGTDNVGTFGRVVTDLQIGTSGGFSGPADPGNGGALPAGLYWHRRMLASHGQNWEDETNGTGGSIPYDNEKVHDFFPAEKVVNADVTLDAGQSVNLHFDVSRDGDSGAAVEYVIEMRLYVAERED